MSRIVGALLFAVTVLCVLMAYGIRCCVRRVPQQALSSDTPLHADIVYIGDNESKSRLCEVLLLSPAYTSNLFWLAVLKHWPPTDGVLYRFIVPDMLGYGKSRWSGCAEDYEMPNQVRLLKECVHRHAVDPASVHYVAICIGGLYAIALAAEHRPASLTLLSTPFFRSATEAIATGSTHNRCYKEPWRLRLVYYLFRQRWLFGGVFAKKAAAKYPLIERSEQSVMDGSLFAMEEVLVRIMAHYRPQVAATFLGNSGVPSLCVRGANDRLCPADQQIDMIERLRARSLVLKGSRRETGHVIMAQNPKLILQQVVQFIESVSRCCSLAKSDV